MLQIQTSETGIITNQKTHRSPHRVQIRQYSKLREYRNNLGTK